MRYLPSLGRFLWVCVFLASGACGSELTGTTGEYPEDAGGQPDVALTDSGDFTDADPAQDAALFDVGDENTPDTEDEDEDADAEDEDAADSGTDAAHPEDPKDPIDEDDDFVLPANTQFVWPAPGWITSTDYYPTGKEHSGSADLALPYWTDIGAARGGTVEFSGWGSIGGYYVRINHGDGYKTVYSHLSAPPEVSKGDTVVTGQLLGYAGRTGNAYNGGCHLHFSISRDGQRLVIPGLAFGDWVDRGEPIAGSYTPLQDLTETGERFFDIKIHEDVGIHEAPSGNSPILSTAKKGEILTVTASQSGYYRVRHQGQRGFVVHTATRPLKSEISSVRITAQNANIRSEPDTNSEVVGTLPNGRIITIFETQGNWQRLLFKVPTTYRWTHTSNTVPTEEFSAKIRSKNANVRRGPGTQHASVGLLPFNTPIHVLEVKQGWYRIQHEGQNAWVAGWLTQGQL